MKKFLTSCAALLTFAAATVEAKEPIDWVNPFIGTTNFGTTNPGRLCQTDLCRCRHST